MPTEGNTVFGTDLTLDGDTVPYVAQVKDCPKCEGTGKVPRSDNPSKKRKCGDCGGLGVLAPGDDAQLNARALHREAQLLNEDGTPVPASKSADKEWRKVAKVLLKARRFQKRAEQEQRQLDEALDALTATNRQVLSMGDRLAAVEKSVWIDQVPHLPTVVRQPPPRNL